jgi:hypothetical protein
VIVPATLAASESPDIVSINADLYTGIVATLATTEAPDTVEMAGEVIGGSDRTSSGGRSWRRVSDIELPPLPVTIPAMVHVSEAPDTVSVSALIYEPIVEATTAIQEAPDGLQATATVIDFVAIQKEQQKARRKREEEVIAAWLLAA